MLRLNVRYRYMHSAHMCNFSLLFWHQTINKQIRIDPYVYCVHRTNISCSIRNKVTHTQASEAPSNRLSFVLSARLNRVVRVHILRFYIAIVDIVIISCGCTPQDIIFTAKKKRNKLYSYADKGASYLCAIIIIVAVVHEQWDVVRIQIAHDEQCASEMRTLHPAHMLHI